MRINLHNWLNFTENRHSMIHWPHGIHFFETILLVKVSSTLIPNKFRILPRPSTSHFHYTLKRIPFINSRMNSSTKTFHSCHHTSKSIPISIRFSKPQTLIISIPIHYNQHNYPKVQTHCPRSVQTQQVSTPSTILSLSTVLSNRFTF